VRNCAIALSLVLAGAAHGASYNATFTLISNSNLPGTPIWRGWTAMTWVGSLNRIVMWGGSGAYFYNDIDALDPIGGAWTTLQSNVNCPGNASFYPPNGSDENGVVWDAMANRLWILNGGSGYRCASAQYGAAHTAGAGTTSTSVVDPTLSGTTDGYYNGWTVSAPDGSSTYVVAYSASSKTLSLGAPINVTAGQTYVLYADAGSGTWSYDFATGTYSKLQFVHWGYSGIVPPGSRHSPGFAGDGTKAFLFGGVDYDNATYKLDFATDSYSVVLPQNATTSPPARIEIQNEFVYDSTHNLYVLFGGWCTDPTRCTYFAPLSDTWVYDPTANSWTPVTGGPQPPARAQAQMYFDQANDVVVLYGGGGTAGALNDLWTFDPITLAWTQQSVPATNPGGVYLGQSGYAPTSGCGYIVYGLSAGANATGNTWKLCLAQSTVDKPPVASFTVAPSTASPGTSIAFNGSASSDPDGTITGYAWNFGDGTTGSGVTASHSYATAGTYSVSLTVTSNAGLTGSSSTTITIDQPPSANFVATPAATTVGTPIGFNGSASTDVGGSITGYAWNFGDGTTGSGVTASHSYATAGTYSVSLTVTDNAGLTNSIASSVTITAAGGTSVTWLDDTLPSGSVTGGNEPFAWVSSNPAPYSGSLAHQSALMSGVHQHYFAGASPAFSVASGDILFTYVYLDPANPPSEVMLQWFDGSGWEHRAYWGANLITWGSWDAAHHYMGPLPATGQWVQLAVPAAQVGLTGMSVSGIAYTLYNGRATWDDSGDLTLASVNRPPVANFVATPAATTVGTPIGFNGSASTDVGGSITGYAWNFGDGTTGSGVTASHSYATAGTYSVSLTVTDNAGLTNSIASSVTITAAGGTSVTWLDDTLPSGSVTGGNEPFAWVSSNPAPYSGSLAHQSALMSGVHQHYFAGASPAFSVASGDILFTYVYLDPANPPSEVMLQWFDGSGWEHRAYWGANLITWGSWDAAHHYMGPLPATGQWVQLAVPAAQVDLTGMSVSGIAYTLYNGRATWDDSGDLTLASVNRPPVANFVATPAATTVGTPIGFNGSASTDVGGSITGYAWNFGDGTTGSGVTASHSYATAGTYSVSLTVTDNAGLTNSIASSVTITAAGGTSVTWLDDTLPSGSVTGGNEPFAWVSSNPAPYSGSLAHQSALMSGVHQHYFAGASPAFSVASGDILFTYVYLDPANPPSEVMLQWFDGSGWEHRAYWGANLITWGSWDAAHHYMGPLPATGQWVQLAVPAAQVGLVGMSVSGIAYTLYNGRATWDDSGDRQP
jgi:PKD repeat protein